MREINTETIGKMIYDALLEINFVLPDDVKDKIHCQLNIEKSSVAKSILAKIEDNYRIAEKKKIPLCQDTGMVVVFLEIGQEVHFYGKYIEDVINENVSKAYIDAYLRKSIVKSPTTRVNTQDNTPAVVHYKLVAGESMKISIAVKGFGSENMSRMALLKPSDGLEGVLEFVVETVKIAGPNPCPPIVVGVGVGGTIEKAALMAKQALMREIGSENQNTEALEMEKILMKRINDLQIGPMGMRGDTTALGVHVELYPTHIAGLPVVVNINCHSSRHKEMIL
ncbi:MAG: fumarate hydratase [Clostridiales bacterium]|nr:fumarate hydratase [Clostridiales bacterium]